MYWATGGSDAGQITFRTRDAEELVNHGSAIALNDLVPQLIGGDTFVKRALVSTLAQAGGNPQLNGTGAAGSFEANTLLGNIAVAQDYSAYLRDMASINSLLTIDPDGAFSASWALTLARAMELGLHKRAITGLDRRLDPVHGSGLRRPHRRHRLRARQHRLRHRSDLHRARDRLLRRRRRAHRRPGRHDRHRRKRQDREAPPARTRSSSAVPRLRALPDSPSTVQRALVLRTSSMSPLRSTAVPATISSSQAISATISSAATAMTRWLAACSTTGCSATRVTIGSSVAQPTISSPDGDASATAAALNTAGNGDMLDGGAGNDVLYGTKGSDWLVGGEGVDTLYGGAGADVIHGGGGNDRGASGEARLLGGAGTDQYIFGFGDGVDVVFDEADNSGAPGFIGNSLHMRLVGIDGGTIQRNWAGVGDYEADGDVKGGVDAISFGPGISMSNLILRRSGTLGSPGSDLIIQLTQEDPITHARVLTGDELTIKDWFEPTRRVEWLRFADGQALRLGDINSTIVGTTESDVIIGTQANDFLVGDAGNDTIRGLGGDDFGFGDSGNDFVAGDEDNDFVAGGTGDDQVLGGLGHDTVFGDGGADYVYGGGGSDIVSGGEGDDQVIGGAGDDIFRYQRGDGSDIVIDEYVNNWDLVWQNGSYVNGYVLDSGTGAVVKGGVTAFDGSRWLGVYDYNDTTQTLRRHLGAVSGAISPELRQRHAGVQRRHRHPGSAVTPERLGPRDRHRCGRQRRAYLRCHLRPHHPEGLVLDRPDPRELRIRRHGTSRNLRTWHLGRRHGLRRHDYRHRRRRLDHRQQR